MKNLTAFSALVALFLAFSFDANAQKKGLTARYISHFYDNGQEDFGWLEQFKGFKKEGESDNSGFEQGGMEIAYHNHFRKNLGYSVPFRLGSAHVLEGSKVRQQGYAGLDALLRLSLVDPEKRFVPFLQAGPGVQRNFPQKKFFPSLNLNGGLNWMLEDGVYLTGLTEYRLSFSKDKFPSGFVSGLGLTFDFGGGPKDTDGDGIIDRKDKCPTVRGIALFEGCPDSDGDGIQDSEDDCVSEAGIAEFKGCPDTDGDGIKNADDKCPDVKGSKEMMGCPDTDGDGLADVDDKCPTEKGSKALAGCPDTDGDGVIDMEDKCPKEKGLKERAGCPAPADSDGDGIVDADDACPKVKGIAAFKGCPDTDGDGVEDAKDKCVDKAGPASNQGCPEMKAEEKKRFEMAMKMVQFETNQDRLLKSSTAILDEIASIMAAYPEANLRIEGHTDSQGNDAFNQSLSEARAKQCLEYLAKKGVARSRMTSSGYGETRPVADNGTAAGRDLNRRVEFNTYY